jgi:anti-sigma factor RsiW
MNCDENNINIPLYLDDELIGKEAVAFREHLTICGDCARRLEEDRMLSSLLTRSRPLYAAPPDLLVRVRTIVRPATPSPHALPGLRWQQTGAAVAAMLLIVFGVGLWRKATHRIGTTDYIEVAVATHRSYLNGELPLEIRSQSPADVISWFSGKLPFHLQLPSLQVAGDETSAYHLSGARLVNYRGTYAALISYQLQHNTISLVVTSSSLATATGCDQAHSGGLIFHYCVQSGFNVVTWTNHELTYALVSSQHGSTQQSCLVCHRDVPKLKDPLPQ